MRKALNHLKKSDPVMGGIIERVGRYAIEYHEPTFHSLVRSIVFQQLNGKAASTIFGRLVDACKVDPITPESILKLRPARLRKLGLSTQKMTYVRELARMTRDGDVDFERCVTIADGEVVEHLTQVKGIGVWTAHMFLIFALRRTDVLPTGDLGVRMAIRKAYELSDLPKPAEIEAIAGAWRPYCSIAAWYLWRSLDNEAAL
jgi:DNA-3-methyladenine glycosylase II